MEIMIPDATHGAGIFTYIWMLFEVNVDEYYMEHMWMIIMEIFIKVRPPER